MRMINQLSWHTSLKDHSRPFVQSSTYTLWSLIPVNNNCSSSNNHAWQDSSNPLNCVCSFICLWVQNNVVHCDDAKMFRIVVQPFSIQSNRSGICAILWGTDLILDIRSHSESGSLSIHWWPQYMKVENCWLSNCHSAASCRIRRQCGVFSLAGSGLWWLLGTSTRRDGGRVISAWTTNKLGKVGLSKQHEEKMEEMVVKVVVPNKCTVMWKRRKLK